LNYSDQIISSLPNDIEIQKIVGQKSNLIIHDTNSLLIAPDGLTFTPKLNCLVLPSLYLLFDWHIKNPDALNGFVKCYVAKGVENFLFNGADLMWPGIIKCDE
jgi:predicted ribosome-associated RNA-binding protein Tma20